MIDRCNFRCDYCMPRETYGEDYSFLDPEHYLSFDEIARLVRLFSRRSEEASPPDDRGEMYEIGG